jgi:hypothetical protein
MSSKIQQEECQEELLLYFLSSEGPNIQLGMQPMGFSGAT